MEKNVETVSFTDIQKANELIKTLSIEHYNKKSGKTEAKEYAEVNQRVKAFRSVYPTGFIITEMQPSDSISGDYGVCLFRATVGFYDAEGNQVVLATGTAYEKENESLINKTSYIENCETSAVGRALGLCGFGIDTSIASYEEVDGAIKQQDSMTADSKKTDKPATERQKELVKKMYPSIAEAKLASMTMQQASEAIKKYNEKKEGKKND